MKKKRPPVVFFLFFALFWSAITLAFDVMIVRNLVRQTESLGYATTEGRILSSEVTTNSDGDGTTYGAKVRYEYHVDGRRYESDRVRFGQMSESSGKWARRTVRENPVGATRPVYHDPADPATSVLQTGAGGQDWFLALFLTPFNVAMLFLWGLVWNARRPAPAAGGACIAEEMDGVRVQLQPARPAVAALVTVGLLAFLSVFAVGLPWGFSPPASVVLTTGFLSLAASAVVYVRTKAAKPAAHPHLIINAAVGTLTLPRRGFNDIRDWSEWRAWKKAGKPPLVIPIADLLDVVANERSSGESTTHVVTLVVRDDAATGGRREHDLGSWMMADRAESFAAWLRASLGLAEKAAEVVEQP